MLCVILIGVITAIGNPAKSEPESTIVETTYGPVKGEELEFEGTNYTAFKGIPYAAPPVGDLRFKAPVPPDNWTEVRDATKFGSICPQLEKMSGASEDCLTLNVYTPSLEANISKAVLFFIHGGAFTFGDGTDAAYGPHYLLQQDIVVITINYRLGALGFLATNTSDASGNWGLKDQVAAMKWVQDNIARFGGDPKKVTIYGESAGGMSTDFHLLSPVSKGLFRSAISSSGAASLYTIRSAHQQRKYSRNLAKILGASEDEIEDPAKRIQFLRSADPMTMSERVRDVLDEEDTADPLVDLVPFLPVVEAFGDDGAFLTENPEKLLAEGKFTKVPLIMGLNDLDGGITFFPIFGKNKTSEARREIEKNVCLFLPSPFKQSVIARNECSLVGNKIRDTYFNGGSFSKSLLNFTYLAGDILFAKDVHYAQKMHAKYADKHSPLYNYLFTFDGEWSVFRKMFGLPFPGAIHAEDLNYVFKPAIFTLPELPSSSPTVITKDRMISFISNFVKYGDPTPSITDLVPVKWKPATKSTPYTMFIGKELKLEKGYWKTRMDMWDELRAKYIEGKSRGGRSTLDVFCLSSLWFLQRDLVGFRRSGFKLVA